MQLAAGRWLLHEHPWGARSWHEPCMQDLVAMSGVEYVMGHQCQQGMGGVGERRVEAHLQAYRMAFELPGDFGTVG